MEKPIEVDCTAILLFPYLDYYGRSVKVLEDLGVKLVYINLAKELGQERIWRMDITIEKVYARTGERTGIFTDCIAERFLQRLDGYDPTEDEEEEQEKPKESLYPRDLIKVN